MIILDKTKNFWDTDRNIFVLSFLFLLVISLPLLLLGGNVPYTVWDNLDSNVVWRKLIIENHLIFADNNTIIHQMMDVPRSSLGGELNLFVLLAKIFPSAVSLGVNRFLQIMIGFIGMFLLCRKYIIVDKRALFAAIVSILFAILPHWSSGCLSVAAQPLVVYSFLRIRDRESTIWNWIVIVLYPFVSSFIVFGFFFYVLLFAIFCFDWYKSKKIHLSLFFALLVLSILSIVAEWRNIMAFFVETSFISHRTEFAPVFLSFGATIKEFIVYCIYGQPHAPSKHFVILFVSIVIFFYSWLKYKKPNLKLTTVLMLFFFIAGFASIEKWTPVKYALTSVSFLRMFQIDRFYTLFPLISFTVFAFAMNEIIRIKYNRLLLFVLFSVQILFSLKTDYTYSGLIKRTIGVEDKNVVTFNEFYSESLFDDIKKHIGKPENSYKVAALGFHPAVLQYNGFYTIDGYCVNYDVNYKHKFGKLIAGELEKNKENALYFNTWGSRCYIFDDEAKLSVYKSDIIETKSLDLNYDILRSLNCQYIISSVQIKNLEEHLNLQSMFENKTWVIYLYKVI